MKKQLLTIIATGLGATLYAQTATSTAAITTFQRQYNNNQTDSIFYSFGDRMKQLVPLDKTKDMMGQLSAQLGKMNSFELTKEEAPFYYFKTPFDKGTVSIVFSLSKDNKFESFRILPYRDESAPKEKSNFVYKSPTGDIYGTLTLPAGTAKVPVVLLIAGSGPTDRNGNQSGISTNCYKMVADSLLSKGIACVRFDKRGIGESAAAAGKEENISFDDMVGDVAGMLKMLKADARFSKVIVLGHSEGSLLGMIAAGKEKVSGYISLAGAGERADKILTRQLAVQSPTLSATAVKIMDSIRNGYTLMNVEPDLKILFRPSVQPYLRSWFRYDPQLEIKKLAIPVLVLQGTTDIQVAVSDAQLLKKASPKATLKLIEGMNHVLKQAPADRAQNMTTYTNPTLPLSPGLMPAIYSFVAAAQ